MNGLKYMLGSVAAIGTFYALKRRSDDKLKLDELKYRLRLEDIDQAGQDRMRKAFFARQKGKTLTAEEMLQAYKMTSPDYDSGF